MVAKINRGASLYGAIIYNQQKVNEDTARIIAGNRMITDSLYDPDRIVRQTMFAFESYLAANRNTEKPILHISLNPTLDDNLTDSQFADLARAYMQKMGYGNQPYIVYLHEDIDRRHIHIVSTCVNENGVWTPKSDKSLHQYFSNEYYNFSDIFFEFTLRVNGVNTDRLNIPPATYRYKFTIKRNNKKMKMTIECPLDYIRFDSYYIDE